MWDPSSEREDRAAAAAAATVGRGQRQQRRSSLSALGFAPAVVFSIPFVLLTRKNRLGKF